jgi:alkylresorcinol/alkylpyrone synthase
MTNFVASCLFADGAAAAVVTGRPGTGARIVTTRSELLPGTQHIMGFELADGGLHVRLDRDIVPLLHRELPGLFERFLTPRGLSTRDLTFFALHPGGRRLLEVMEERMEISRDATVASWDVLRDYGNMSSATVLFVLERLLRTRRLQRGERGLLAAFGPGFSAEMALLQWN